MAVGTDFGSCQKIRFTGMITSIMNTASQDISRIAEILIFTKRINYRAIFQNDAVSFSKMQVVPLAEDLLKNDKLRNYWVYDDEFVKGLIHIEGEEIIELYVDCFFENQGIGNKLIDFAIKKKNVS